jgi:hypothetical protein
MLKDAAQMLMRSYGNLEVIRRSFRQGQITKFTISPAVFGKINLVIRIAVEKLLTAPETVASNPVILPLPQSEKNHRAGGASEADSSLVQQKTGLVTKIEASWKHSRQSTRMILNWDVDLRAAIVVGRHCPLRKPGFVCHFRLSIPLCFYGPVKFSR